MNLSRVFEGVDSRYMVLLAIGIILLIIPSIIINFTKTTTVGDTVNIAMILKPGSAIDARVRVPVENAELFIASASTNSNVVYSIRVLDENNVEYGNEIVSGTGQWRYLLGDPGTYRIILYYPAAAVGDLEVSLVGYVEYEVPRANTPAAYSIISLSILGALIAGYAAGIIATTRATKGQVSSMEEKE